MSHVKVPLNPADRRRHVLLWGSLIIIVASLLYGVTLQVDINGSDDGYAIDVGEFQNVLAQWGTSHPTGYPLYSFSGAIFVNLLRTVGVSPAAAASVYAAVLTILALIGVYALLLKWRVAPPLAAGTVLLLAVIFPFWFNASAANTRSMLIALMVLAYLIVAQWWSDRNPRRLMQLAFVAGLAVGHHRLAILALPGLAIYAGPLFFDAVRDRPVRIVKAGTIFLASFLIYLYLPIRAWMGGSWVYGQPGTWEGFWSIITAREYETLTQPAAALSTTGAGFTLVLSKLAANLTWPILITGAVGLVLSLIDKARRWISLSLIVLAVANVAFSGLLPRAVYLPSALMPAMLAIVLGLGLLAEMIAGRQWLWQAAALMLLAGGALAMIAANEPGVWSLTHDPSGRATIDNVVSARLVQTAERPVVFALWGRDFFALKYAQAVTGELASIDVVDHRADVKVLIDGGRPLYVLARTFGYERRAMWWWDKRLGRAYLSSFAGDLVRVSNQPVLTEADLPPVTQTAPMGQSVALRASLIEPLETERAWHLTLYWQALSPVERDYSVFVHASDRDAIDSPDAIIAQADSAAPVYGWYPTSRWSVGEIVRDDYEIQIPSGKSAKIIAVGLYYRDESGAFHNLGQQIIRLPQ